MIEGQSAVKRCVGEIFLSFFDLQMDRRAIFGALVQIFFSSFLGLELKYHVIVRALFRFL